MQEPTQGGTPISSVTTDRVTSKLDSDGHGGHSGSLAHSHATASTANLVAAVAQAYAEQQEKLKTGGMSQSLSGSHEEEGSNGTRLAAGYASHPSSSRAASMCRGSSDKPVRVSAHVLSGARSNVPDLTNVVMEPIQNSTSVAGTSVQQPNIPNQTGSLSIASPPAAARALNPFAAAAAAASQLQLPTPQEERPYEDASPRIPGATDSQVQQPPAFAIFFIVNLCSSVQRVFFN